MEFIRFIGYSSGLGVRTLQTIATLFSPTSTGRYQATLVYNILLPSLPGSPTGSIVVISGGEPASKSFTEAPDLRQESRLGPHGP